MPDTGLDYLAKALELETHICRFAANPLPGAGGETEAP
jgi:hypothetical protein